jgi:type II secretory pathway pseudopilin PulG
MAMIKCPECKKKISNTAERCPNCGLEITEDVKFATFKQKEKDKKRNKIILSIVIVILFMVLVSAIWMVTRQINNGNETKQFYQNAEIYNSALGTLYDEFHEYTSTYSKVWKNSIYQIEDDETDEYTTDDDGEFFDDFNDALSSYVASDEYLSDATEINNIYSEENAAYENIKIKDDDDEQQKNIKDMIDGLHENIVNLYKYINDYGYTYNDYTEKTAKYLKYIQKNQTKLEIAINNQ